MNTVSVSLIKYMIMGRLNETYLGKLKFDRYFIHCRHLERLHRDM